MEAIYDKLAYQMADLLKDGMHWRDIYDMSENDKIKALAKENMQMLINMHNRSNQMLMQYLQM